MAIRPLNSIAGFSTGDPAVQIIQANGDINTINFTANGLVNLGNVGNVNIGGGSNGQYLKTDGVGNLTWDGIGNLASNRAAPMPYLIPTGESYIVNENFQGLYSQAITIDGELEVDGILIEVPISFAAEPNQILFAENGSPAGNTGFTFDIASGNVQLPGNVDVKGNILPNADVTYNLGSSTKRWNDIWLSDATIYIGNSSISTDANALVFSSASGATLEVAGNANVSILQNGNSNITIDTSADITFGVAGTPNVLVLTSNGLRFTGTLNVTGNIAPTGIKTDNYYYANGSPLDFQQPAGSNTQIQYNNNNDFGASANFTFNSSTNVLTVTGNITASNISGGNLVSANFVSGTLTTASQPNITSVGTLGSLAVTANVVAGNVYSNSGTIGANLLTGTLTTAAQPNITSLGTLTTLETSGNAIIGGNLFVNGNITYINVDTIQVEDPIIVVGGGPNGAPLTTNDGKDRGTLLQYYTSAPVSAFMGWDNSNGEFAFGSNVTESSDVITFTALGNVRASTYLGNISGVTGNFSGNISAANASLGNIANANYLVSNSGCVSVAGAFIAVSAGTGGIFNSGVNDINFGLAANVTMGSTTGNVTARGNLIANNISTTGNISANLITGTLTTAAQANITTVGTLGNLTVSGNTVSNIVDANTTQTQSIVSKRSNVAVTTLTVIDSFATSAYRTAKYVVSSQNDDGYESLEVLLIHNNINSYITVYGAINDGGGNTVTMSTGINSGNVELRATGLAGNTVVKLIGTYVPD